MTAAERARRLLNDDVAWDDDEIADVLARLVDEVAKLTTLGNAVVDACPVPCSDDLAAAIDAWEGR
jgi:hypothetical protein